MYICIYIYIYIYIYNAIRRTTATRWPWASRTPSTPYVAQPRSARALSQICYTTLNYTKLNYIILYYTVLYYTVLYYTQMTRSSWKSAYQGKSHHIGPSET